MRGLRLLLVPSVLIGALSLGTQASAQAGDRDCDDFSFQEDAQAFFEANRPGDPHDLDRDNDGIACEALPKRGTSQAAGPAAPQAPRSPRTPGTPRTPRTPRTSIPANEKDCDDFKTQAEAQAFFNAAGAGDPHRLDTDNDGVACETLRRTSATLPQTGMSTARIGLAGSVLLLAGLLLMTAAHRRGASVAVASANNTPSDTWDGVPLIGW